jgi:uncharacterized membrane protein YkoI
MRILLLFLALAAGTISPSLAVADREPDAETLRKWVEAGEVLPLEKLLARHRERIPGRLLDLEVEREHGRIVYKLEVVNEWGQVYEIYLDAQSGEWLGQELED